MTLMTSVIPAATVVEQMQRRKTCLICWGERVYSKRTQLKIKKMNFKTSIFVVMTLAIVVCAIQHPVNIQQETSSDPARPQIPTAFATTYRLVRTTKSGKAQYDGTMNYDLVAKKQLENFKYGSYQVMVLFRYDMGTEYQVIMNQCSKISTQGMKQDMFADLATANYTGQQTLQGEVCDIWTAINGSVTTTFAVAKNTPVIIQKQGKDFSSIMVFSNFVAGPQKSSLFDVPSICGSVVNDPTKPKIPSEMTADMTMKTAQVSLTGKFYLSNSVNAMRMDYSESGSTFTDLFDYNDQALYVVVPSGCQHYPLQGNSTSFFGGVTEASYQGHDATNNCDKWGFNTNVTWCFNADTPVYFRAGQDVEYTWSNVQLTTPDASLFDVPASCKSVVKDPTKPKIPTEMSAEYTMKSAQVTLNGKFYLSDTVNSMRMDSSVNGNAFTDLFDYNDQALYVVLPSSCQNYPLSGNSSGFFGGIEEATFQGHDATNNCEKWGFNSANVTWCFNADTPVYFRAATEVEFTFTAVQLTTPASSLFTVPASCKKTSMVIEEVGREDAETREVALHAAAWTTGGAVRQE
eukprot:TRINITY_DN3817_c1_g1_i2.p1 TRINITY_DN3817_c1_g1~~TRINITY_DN3817_c1_g1_i2.p1  ORF type:complete len:575 (+),score=179.53 TRINITY_DN3817_c1_g1_i2:1100-2824(+)